MGVMLVMASVSASAQDNASNPLAAVSNTDLRFQYIDLGGSHLKDLWVDGAYMVAPKLKVKYELHYWSEDAAGTTVSDFQSFHLKPIYFPTQGAWGSWKYKLAVGFEWIMGLTDEEIGIRLRGKQYSDQLAPLVGLTLVKGKYGSGPTDATFRVVQWSGYQYNRVSADAIQSLPNSFWLKLDAMAPIEWENDNAVPAEAELQLGKMFSPSLGVYMDGLLGIGGDRPYEWGVGAGAGPASRAALTEARNARALRRSWAQLIKRIYEVDPLVCPSCGSEMKVIAFIVEHAVVDAILRHLEKAETRSPRGPPGAATLPAVS